jgi:hypothetical protein
MKDKEDLNYWKAIVPKTRKHKREMSWKQIKIFTADAKQSVVIEPNPEKDGMVMHSIEEHDNESFMLHMTFEEAETIGQELIKYAEEMKAFNTKER